MRIVLDTSALLSGRPFAGELFVTSAVLREVRRKGTSATLELFLDAKVVVAEPGPSALAAVDAAAGRTRDDRRLSPVDRGVLALALEVGAAIATDDYSIQNLSTELGIAYLGVMQPGITETVHWQYRCSGCGRVWKEWHSDCPACGSPLRTSRSGRDRAPP